MKSIACIDDLRQLARRRVPRAFFEYAESGSYNEETLRANRTDLEAIKLRQRILVDVSSRSLDTTITTTTSATIAPLRRLSLRQARAQGLSSCAPARVRAEAVIRAASD